MKTRAPPAWLGPLLLLCAVSPALLNDCPQQCGHELVLRNCRCEPCRPGEYWYLRSGVGTCDRCTSKCSDPNNNMVEVWPCTKISKRICKCRPGFFCPSVTEIHCRVPCEPCPDGTFSNTTSLKKSCKPHSKCSSSELVIAEGSATQDRVCASPTTTTKPTTTSTTKPTTTTKPATTSTSIPTTTPQPTTTTKPTTTSIPTATTIPLSNSTLLNSTVPSTSIPTSQTPKASSPITTLLNSPPQLKGTDKLQSSSETTASHRPTRHTSRFSSVTNTPSAKSTGRTDSYEGPSPPHSFSSWMFVLLVAVFFLLVATCFSMKCKARNLKEKLDWPGLTFRKYQLQNLQKPEPVVYSLANDCRSSEVQLPLGSDRSHGTVPASCPGGNQQVTMDHNGKGENISNTVGSIFIYSPGMVVLGSNSKERKEEVEELSEGVPLMSVPQQESSLHPQEDSVGAGMQGEFGKELSFPVPATSK